MKKIILLILAYQVLKKSTADEKISGISHRQTPWFSPYWINENGKERTALKQFTASAHGVYLIRSKQTGAVLYVGSSSCNLYSTLYRHFQSWTDGQHRATYQSRTAYEVKILISDRRTAHILESEMIDRHQPRDNKAKYQGQRKKCDWEKQIHNSQPAEEAPF